MTACRTIPANSGRVTAQGPRGDDALSALWVTLSYPIVPLRKKAIETAIVKPPPDRRLRTSLPRAAMLPIRTF